MEPAEEPDARLGTTSLLDYAADLEHELNGLLAPPILMGHSMGGLLAQMLAARREVKALVLLNPAQPRGIVSLRPSMFWSFRGTVTKWGFWKKPFRPSPAEARYGLLHLFGPQEQEATYETLVYESDKALYELSLAPLDRRHASSVDESRVRCPVLVVSGSQDRVTPVSIGRAIAKKYGADYKEFPDHGHLTILEPGWREVAGYVSDWLKRTVEV